MVCCATMPGNCINSRRKCAGFMMTFVATLFVTWFLYSSSIDMAPTSMSYGTSNTSKARETDWRRSTSAILTQAKNRSQLQNSSYTRVADPRFSEIRINGKYQFQVGDVINVSIILKDREGRMIVTGGDDIRIWMKSTNGRNRTSGHVIDHGNGSYTGVLRAFWEGHPVITVSIAWTRQHLNIKDRFLSSHVPYNFLYASFESGSLKEVTRCNITKTSENMCDFTAQNGGHPWLCERPKEKRLPCSSRKSHHSATAGDYHTPAEKQFIKRLVWHDLAF
ncbi:NXPE family member 3-like [Haliotis rufescens]|uniref:NXPE family member 3-like n=1 Tax=Haliotis rufescens TaxID=6454 RepID=UPI00201E8725|nr:NXPE family member 3-like [Haliotis rufescens]